MQNIRIKNGNTVYYIAVLDTNTANSVSQIASAYQSITQVINYSAKRVYPDDITITDIKNFGKDKCSDITFTYNSVSITSPGVSGSVDKGGYDHYSARMTGTEYCYQVKFQKFTSADLQSLGGLLKKLIKTAHSHK